MTPIVECYAGSTYPERPRAFFWEGQRYEVKEIIDQHREPDGILFLVLCEKDEKLFELFYNSTSMEWRVEPKNKTIKIEKSDQNLNLKEC
jgi:hypothetical protein